MIKSHRRRAALLTDLCEGQFVRTLVCIDHLPARTILKVTKVGKLNRPNILISYNGTILHLTGRELLNCRFRRVRAALVQDGYVASGDYVMRTDARLRFLDGVLDHGAPLMVSAIGPTGTASLHTYPLPLHVAADEFRPETFVSLGKVADTGDAIRAALRSNHHFTQPGALLLLRPGDIIRRTGRAMGAFHDARTPHNAYLQVVRVDERSVIFRALGAATESVFPLEYATEAFFASCDEPV